MNLQGDYTAFEIQYLDAHQRKIQNATAENFMIIKNLRPFKNYTFTVITRSGSENEGPIRRSTPISAIFETKESVPGSLNVFEPTEVQPSMITFVWELSSLEANGVLTGFIIQYGVNHPHDHGFIPEESREFGSEERKGVIEGLKPGKDYIFQIQARTQVGYGAWVRWEQTMPIWAPPVPNRDVFPTEISHTMNTISIRFRRNYFSDVNGKVIAYTVNPHSLSRC